MNIKLRTEVKVGIIAIFVIGMLIWGINFLKGRDIFSSRKTYYAVYSDLNGVTPSASVFINGLKVGRLKNITYQDAKLKKFILDFEIRSDIRLPINSSTRVYSSDILGSKALEIIMGDARVYCEEGDTIQSDFVGGAGMLDEVAKQLKPIKDRAESILNNLDTVISSVKFVLNTQTQADLVQTLQQINTMSLHLSRVSVQLDGLMESEKKKVSSILTNVESVSSNLRENNDKLSNVITNFSNLSDSLAKSNISKTLRDANSSMESLSNILKKIDGGKGNMGMLINNDSLYSNMERSIKNLDLLIDDIRKNPKRYIHISIF